MSCASYTEPFGERSESSQLRGTGIAPWPSMAVRRSIHEYSRQAMIESLERRSIAAPCLLAAVASVPREAFVPPAQVIDAYADRELLIDRGETLASPFVSIHAIEALELQADDRVLEIGTGTGYTAAVL